MLGGHDGIAQLGFWLPSLAQISFCAIAATGDIGSPPMRLVPLLQRVAANAMAGSDDGQGARTVSAATAEGAGGNMD